MAKNKMLVRCPSCGGKIRITETATRERLTFLCNECQQIVHLDPRSDEIATTSSAPKPQEGRLDHRVLVVDDSLTFAEMVRDLLECEGYDVILAKDGVEALKKITESSPDAVFLDLFMPRMTGFEVLRTLRTSPGFRRFQNIPVLVTSGIYHPAEFDILNELGVSGYITKENVPLELVFRIRKILFRAHENTAPPPAD